MLSLRVIICLFLVVVCSADGASDTLLLNTRIEQIGKLITDKPQDFDSLFTAPFLQAVPAQRLLPVLKSTFVQNGSYVSHLITESKGKFAADAMLLLSKGYRLPVSISLEPHPPHRVAGLFFRIAEKDVTTVQQVTSALGKLDGTVSACIMDLEKGTVIFEQASDRGLAIGSAFKLYLLAALANDVENDLRTWADVANLDSSNFSYPSGMLQTWPHGSPLTLHSLASKMISISDNTATDLLIDVVGRGRVESLLPTLGNSHATRNIPFLKTREALSMKFTNHGQSLMRYVQLEVDEKRSFLTEIGRPADTDFTLSEEPVGIEDVEWFASTRSLCTLIGKLHTSSENKVIKDILSINPGLSLRRDRWMYVGYKGGSEPGVLNLTFLLRHVSGNWYAAAFTWNNPRQKLDESALMALVSGYLNNILAAE